jgi:peptidoglycan/LPS O-acetylase OafA/YrhL
MASSPTANLRDRIRLSIAPDIPSEGNGRIDYLDGWRAVAVGLVVAAHTLSVYGIKILSVGTLGVYLFFGISGYIITRLLLLEQHRTGRIDIPAFYARRIARIMPPLIVFLVAMIVLKADSSIVWQAVRAAAFTCNIGIDGGCIRILEHTWSLAFEEQFYLVYPLLLAGFRRWWMLPLALFWALPFFIPVGYIGQGGFARIVMIMALGAMFAAWERPITELIRRVPRVLLLAMPAVLLAWALLEPGPPQMLAGALVPFAAILTVFGLPLAFPVLRRALCWGVLTRIGLYSYGFYLWQQFFSYPWDWNTGWMPIIGIAAGLGIAALSYHTLERVCRHWAQDYSARRIRRVTKAG